ncbi:MAG: HDOD domain-containing protein [Gammaproteobacteria bacterium]
MLLDASKLTLPKVSPDGLIALDIISSDDPDVKALENCILRDPLLASTIIKYANSPLYRRQDKISNVSTAIRLLGLKNIRSAVVKATLSSMAENPSPTNQIAWQHGTDIALLCRLIAQLIKPEIADDMEFIGLIHDMGLLLLINNFQDIYENIIADSVSDGSAINTLEKERLDVQHDIIAMSFLDQFRLPENYTTLLCNYHSHDRIENLDTVEDFYTAILDLAHHIWQSVMPHEDHFQETIVQQMTELQELLDFPEDNIQEIIVYLESIT